MSIIDDHFEDKTMPAETFFGNGGPIGDPDDPLLNLESRPPTETNHYAVLNVSKFVKQPSLLFFHSRPRTWGVRSNVISIAQLGIPDSLSSYIISTRRIGVNGGDQGGIQAIGRGF